MSLTLLSSEVRRSMEKLFWRKSARNATLPNDWKNIFSSGQFYNALYDRNLQP